MNVKDIITNRIMNDYMKKREESTSLKFNSNIEVEYFIKERLIPHGNKGYYFHAEHKGKQVWYQTCWNDISLIVSYVFESNSQPSKEEK